MKEGGKNAKVYELVCSWTMLEANEILSHSVRRVFPLAFSLPLVSFWEWIAWLLSPLRFPWFLSLSPPQFDSVGVLSSPCLKLWVLMWGRLTNNDLQRDKEFHVTGCARVARFGDSPKLNQFVASFWNHPDFFSACDSRYKDRRHLKCNKYKYKHRSSSPFFYFLLSANTLSLSSKTLFNSPHLFLLLAKATFTVWFESNLIFSSPSPLMILSNPLICIDFTNSESCFPEWVSGKWTEENKPEREIWVGWSWGGLSVEVEVVLELEGDERVRFKDEERKEVSKDVGSERRCLLRDWGRKKWWERKS